MKGETLIPGPIRTSNPGNRAWASVFRVAAAVILGLVLIGSGIAVAASETILSFASHITVDPGATMRVTETIKVVSTGDQIKRGIYRDFPTTYKDRAGNNYVVGFAILAVARDGKPEAYHTETLSNGIRIYMGRKEFVLPPGEYTYTLSYRTDRQLGFFKDHDELYWNVTGNGWNFPIETASATVALPPGVPADKMVLDGYTGPPGAKGKNFTAAVTSDGKAVFETTRRLNAREGLTVVVNWPKGFVMEPSVSEKTVHFLKDNLTLFVAVIGLAVILLYYLLVWFAAGRDPARGTLMPIYSPPDNLSPASMRFMAEMGYDDKVFAAAVINMAVKGYLSIREKSAKYTLTKTDDNPSKLSSEEKKMAAQLFQSGSSISLEQKNHSRIAAAQNALRTSLTLSFEKTHFVTNKDAFVIGAVISAAAVAASFLSALDQPDVLFLGLWLTGWSIGVVFLAVMVVKLWRQVFTGLRKMGTTAGSLGAAVVMTGFALPFFGAEIFVLIILTQSAPALVGLLVVVVFMNMAFYHLLKAPTMLGRRILDRIEGFKMFLGATERDRLQRLVPAERTPELYEKYLPYALALDVEQAWTEQFTDVLSAAMRPDGSGYQPGWYSGSTFDSTRMGSFASTVGSSLGAAVSSSVTAPGSRSGSSSGGGGGSSGGGGGGGGGGGW
ncbi:MAG: DUF2207 domain-containing protein [Syntrophales bacterium]|nr:DUF2207 domain-containing protein [Syntrophales bacterium]